ncbi:unnamed protein product, partial [Mesorhabditis belari]|uniref:Acyl-coenzyme A oxidase n=1 Tax=Mesorhabditis belari TaxID=2138241 RepID=A0AAF3F6N2_9BILA
MPLNHLIRDGDNPDITEERQKATFSTEELAIEIYGEPLAQRRREISAEVLKRPELLDDCPHVFLDRTTKVENSMKKTVAVMEKGSEICDFTSREELGHLVCEVFGDDGFPLSIHFVMFLPAIQGQADDEQAEQWIPRAMRLEFIGTYAQTELGHGTNLRALETTATYDKRTQEFILHTPTVSAYKWWPGNLGKTANYVIANAQLYIDGKSHGPHNFLVQIRDENTHQPMPGITVGDIGPKFGLNTNDNGFLRFDHVRIPRRNMLMRHSKVSADGVYSPPVHPKLSYGAMIFVRATMIRMLAHVVLKAATIAIRYSCVRRQGEIKTGNGEVKILEYQTQQHRLFTALARGFAYRLVGDEVKNLYEKIAEEVKHGNVEQLADLHALLSGMKSIVSYDSGKAIEQCRMACGGHGYSHASGIPEMYAVEIAGCTYEGENMVMLQQQARYLVKGIHRLAHGEELSTMLQYLANTSNNKFRIGESGVDLENALILALEYIARSTIERVTARLDSLQNKGLSAENAWNENAVELTRASRTHTRLWIARCFRDRVHRIENHAIRSALTDILELFLTYEVVDMSQYLYQGGYANSDQVAQVKDAMYKLLEKIRPNAVSYVDAYEVSDTELRSVLGRRDGNVYDNLLKWAKSNPLNRTEVLPAVEKHLMPMMLAAKSKL